MGKMLYQLVKQKSAPTIDIGEFDGNPLQYSYLSSMFRGEEENCQSTKKINLIHKVNNRRSKGAS